MSTMSLSCSVNCHTSSDVSFTLSPTMRGSIRDGQGHNPIIIHPWHLSPDRPTTTSAQVLYRLVGLRSRHIHELLIPPLLQNNISDNYTTQTTTQSINCISWPTVLTNKGRMNMIAYQNVSPCNQNFG